MISYDAIIRLFPISQNRSIVLRTKSVGVTVCGYKKNLRRNILPSITIRQRLQDYEFSDDQEMSLTLELLKRIEADITEIQAINNRAGFSPYVALAGLAATVYVVLGELTKQSNISFEKIGIITFAGILLLKIP